MLDVLFALPAAPPLVGLPNSTVVTSSCWPFSNPCLAGWIRDGVMYVCCSWQVLAQVPRYVISVLLGLSYAYIAHTCIDEVCRLPVVNPPRGNVVPAALRSAVCQCLPVCPEWETCSHASWQGLKCYQRTSHHPPNMTARQTSTHQSINKQ